MNSQNFNYLQRIILTSFFYTNFFSRKFLPLIYFFVNITQKIRLTQIKLCNGHLQITSDKNLDFLTPLPPFIQYCQNLSILPLLFYPPFSGHATYLTNYHCVKSVRIWSYYSGPHFPAFGLNTETYEVSLRIQSECRKMRTKITPNTDTFYAMHYTFTI